MSDISVFYAIFISSTAKMITNKDTKTKNQTMSWYLNSRAEADMTGAAVEDADALPVDDEAGVDAPPAPEMGSEAAAAAAAGAAAAASC